MAALWVAAGLDFILFVFVFVFVEKDWLWQLFVPGGAGLDFILRRILCWRRRRRGIKEKLGSDFSYHHHLATTITTSIITIIITIPSPCLILFIWIIIVVTWQNTSSVPWSTSSPLPSSFSLSYLLPVFYFLSDPGPIIVLYLVSNSVMLLPNQVEVL